MVIKKSSVSAPKRRPGRPMKKPLHSLNLLPLLLHAPENIITTQIMEKESSEKAMVTQDNRPYFFKIILGSTKQRLRIPEKILHHISKDLTKTAVLKIPSGSLWTVQINNTEEDCVFMEDGWPKFLRDNSLKDRHLLVFTYDGDMSFSVQIFEVNGCERDYGATHCTTMAPQEAAGHRNNGKRPRGRPSCKRDYGATHCTTMAPQEAAGHPNNGKRPRGRPSCERDYVATHCTTMAPQEAAGHPNNGKRPRGRPRKNHV